MATDQQALEHAFLLKEFELLRTSVDNAVGELRNLDRWVLVTTAAVWTWILTEHPTFLRNAGPTVSPSAPETAPATLTPAPILLFVPFLIVVAFLLKAVATNHTLDLTNEYLRDLEARFDPERKANHEFGFETYFFEKRKQPAKARTRVRMARIRVWSYAYYAVLMIAYLGMAIWGMCLAMS